MNSLFIKNTLILLCLVSSISILWFGSLFYRKAQNVSIIKQSNGSILMPKVPMRGVYIWQDPFDTSEKKINSDINFLADQGINTTFLDISSIADVNLNNPNTFNTYSEKLKNYVEVASSKKIAVHALAGNNAWGFNDKAYIQTNFLNFVEKYNSFNPEFKLTGLQFDIESYNNKSFNHNKTGYLEEYLSSVQNTVNTYMSHNDKFMLGYTVPYWYDNENGNIPAITINDYRAPIVYHMFETLNQINSYIVMLDYRNSVDGTDGSVAHAQNEIIYATKYTPNIKLVIGQETENVSPKKITFYSENESDLFVALQRISKTFNRQKSYYGIAINDIAGLQALSQK